MMASLSPLRLCVCPCLCVTSICYALLYPPPLRLGMKKGVASHADKGRRKKEKNNKGVLGGGGRDGENRLVELWRNFSVGRSGIERSSSKKSNNRNPTFEYPDVRGPSLLYYIYMFIGTVTLHSQWYYDHFSFFFYFFFSQSST